jgi:transcriptional regulator with XRE-family HTH domain
MVKRKRQARGWSQKDLAERTAGVADQTLISRFENGLIADPGGKLIFAVARAFDMDSDELLSVLCRTRSAR